MFSLSRATYPTHKTPEAPSAPAPCFPKLYLAGMLACGIGVLFTLPIGMVIASNYQAHVYREYVARGGEAVNIAHIREADPQGSSVGPRPQAF